MYDKIQMAIMIISKCKRIKMHKKSVQNIYAILYIILSSTIVTGAYFYSLQLGLDRLSETAKVRIDQSSNRLLEQLASFKQLSNLLARNPKIIEAFEGNSDIKSIDELVQSTVFLSGSEQILLINKTGNVIASSKLVSGKPTEKSINPNEPYVQAALNGRLGYFYAVDKQTLARTIFIARGIYTSSLSPQGVVIIKVDIPSLEYQWNVDDVSLAFFDANDVAFITNRPSMALRRLGSLDKPFLETKHYERNQISKFFDYKKSMLLNHTILKFFNTEELPKEALILSKYIPRLEMTTQVFMSTQVTKFSARVQAGLTAAIFFALGSGLWSLWLRRQRLIDKLAIEEAANAKLEARVEKRTAQLKKAQFQLVQAGKLKALGEISAGISHELNQPLAAMQNFSENGAKMLDLNKIEDARINFDLIGTQINRITRIIKSLRAFARKEKETIVRLTRVGFEHFVGYLQGGFEAWKNANEKIDLIIDIEADELAMDIPFDDQLLVIDVRKENEYADGHLAQAMNIPLTNLTDPGSMADLDDSHNMYVHCAGGYRSVIAISILQPYGYKNLINVEGGFGKIKTLENIKLTETVCGSTK